MGLESSWARLLTVPVDASVGLFTGKKKYRDKDGDGICTWDLATNKKEILTYTNCLCADFRRGEGWYSRVQVTRRGT